MRGLFWLCFGFLCPLEIGDPRLQRATTTAFRLAAVAQKAPQLVGVFGQLDLLLALDHDGLGFHLQWPSNTIGIDLVAVKDPRRRGHHLMPVHKVGVASIEGAAVLEEPELRFADALKPCLRIREARSAGLSLEGQDMPLQRRVLENDRGNF
jgi:hypothetical protein